MTVGSRSSVPPPVFVQGNCLWSFFTITLIIEINVVWWSQSFIGWPCYVTVQVCLQLLLSRSLTYCSEVLRTSTCDHMISIGQECSICIAVILYRLWFSMVTVIFWWILGLRLNDFKFYVIGKKYMLSLQCAFLVLGNRIESSKITSYLELFRTKYFHFGWQNISTYFSRFVKTDWQIIHKFPEY